MIQSESDNYGSKFKFNLIILFQSFLAMLAKLGAILSEGSPLAYTNTQNCGLECYHKD